MDSKFLLFREEERGTKTKYFLILSKGFGSVLGYINWYGPWRKYCFTSMDNIVWDANCLNDVSAFLDDLMETRKEGKMENVTNWIKENLWQLVNKKVMRLDVSFPEATIKMYWAGTIIRIDIKPKEG